MDLFLMQAAMHRGAYERLHAGDYAGSNEASKTETHGKLIEN
jgi:hypothetical protein